MTTSIVRAASVVLFVVAFVAWPRTSFAQQMNFSFYSDAGVSSDDENLYMVVDGFDNSTGCTHYDYQMYGQVNGPTGSYQQSFTGTQAWMFLPAGEGTYSYSGDLMLNCSCFGSGLSAGGGSAIFAVSLPHFPDPAKLAQCQQACDAGQAAAANFCTSLPPFPPIMRVVKAVCMANRYTRPACRGICFAVWGDW